MEVIRNGIPIFFVDFFPTHSPFSPLSVFDTKMISNSEVAPVDTVAPADSTVEGTAISSQASVEDSDKQETPVENATESTEAKASETPVEQVENAQPTEEVKAQDAPVENTQQESTEQAVAE